MTFLVDSGTAVSVLPLSSVSSCVLRPSSARPLHAANNSAIRTYSQHFMELVLFTLPTTALSVRIVSTSWSSSSSRCQQQRYPYVWSALHGARLLHAANNSAIRTYGQHFTELVLFTLPTTALSVRMVSTSWSSSSSRCQQQRYPYVWSALHGARPLHAANNSAIRTYGQHFMELVLFTLPTTALSVRMVSTSWSSTLVSVVHSVGFLWLPMSATLSSVPIS